MRNRVKKLTALGLAAAMVLGTMATAVQAEDTTEAAAAESIQKDVVNVGINADPGSLAPWTSENTGRTAMANCIWQSLGHVIDGEIQGVLMESYELADDESYMDVKIYDYIYDSAGNHITANDVKFSYDTCMEIGSINGLNYIDSCEVLDDYTVRFNFNSVLYVYDIETLMETLYICSEAAYEASPDGMATDPVTTGPYTVTEYTANYIVTCEKNENYWQTDESKIAERDQANVDTINYYILTESTQMTMALQNGSIDMSWTVSTEDLDQFTSTDSYWLYQQPDNLVNELFINCSEGHETADENLRKALYYCVNSEMMLQSVYSGNGILCYDTAAPKAPDWQDAWAEEDNYYHYSLEKAQEYLDAWGGDPSSLNLVILSGNDTAVSNIAQLWQSFMGQLGISAELLTVDSATLSTYSNDPNSWDCYVASKATGNYVTTSWRNCYSKDYFSWGGSINYVFDDELQSLLNTARLNATHTDETVNAVHEYIVEHAYGYGLIDTVNNYVVTSDCSNVVTSYKGAVLPGACSYTA